MCIYLITRNHHPPNLPNDDGSKTLSTSASALQLGRLRVLGLREVPYALRMVELGMAPKHTWDIKQYDDIHRCN